MQDDVERKPQHIKGNCPYCGKSISQADTIAALQAKLDKAVEGLERIEKRATELRNGTDDWFELVEFQIAAQSLIKELRP